MTFFMLYYFAGGLAASFGYHRMLSHKSFQLPRWLEYLIILIGLPAGTPIQWAGNHRRHHATTDLPDDPHSPHHGGFWHAHCGWYIQSKSPIICALYAFAGPLRTLFDAYWRPRTNQEYVHLATDISNDRFYAWLSRPAVYQVICILHVVVAGSIAVAMMGPPGLLIYWASSVLVYNLGDSVDSFGHLYGQRVTDGTSRATNNILLGLFAFGDGWHANHHQNPRRAQHGANYQFDLCWQLIRLLKFLRIAKHVH
jgi:fatty-acid desaturase